MHALGKALVAVLLGMAAIGSVRAADRPEIRIMATVDDVIADFKKADYWGPVDPAAPLEVPRHFTVVTTPVWKREAAALPVDVKKELFYRSILPLVLYANEVIEAERAELIALSTHRSSGSALSPEEHARLANLANRYRLLDVPPEGTAALPEGEALDAMLAELLKRVDVVPPSLALGQAAYESGYGTSRFALEGNSYFGQWTYGGTGMTPKAKRAGKGNYGVAAYDWPLDSVHAYMLNLNTHDAYAALREARATARASAKTVTGMMLVETLTRYSEKGRAYVKTLKGILRINELALANAATLRKEPPVLIVHVSELSEVPGIEAQLAALEASGELDELIDAMGFWPE